MNFKKLYLAFTLTIMTSLTLPSFASEEEAVQHLVLPDITSLQEAKEVFAKTTSELQSKTKLDASELHDIHTITYSHERAIAYFAENLEGEQQVAAQKIAEVVEFVHIDSENSRPSETSAHLTEYFVLAEAFRSEI